MSELRPGLTWVGLSYLDEIGPWCLVIEQLGRQCQNIYCRIGNDSGYVTNPNLPN